MTVPQWVKEAVFYQIFPDRFANGDPSNDPPNVQPWGTPPTARGFQGGDLRGIIQKLDYLTDLGVNALYLNPIFQSPSTHRYNTTDYFRIDSKLGSLEDFHALIDAAHRRGMRVILDGVFNHCGRGFFAFNDILENEAESPYLDWFHIRRFPLRAYEEGQARNYKAWWGIKSLPKFNTDNPQVRRYLLSVARYWIEQGADGWRLDVPNEIDDDSFWAAFREVVRSANPEAYLLGEIWDADPRWVNDSHFDGLMNYPMRAALFDYLNGKLPATAFNRRIETLLAAYAPENVLAMYLLLGSHDTERALTLLGGDICKLKLAALFQFACPGAPAVYYGDEIGLQGGKDPDCRRAFPWNEAEWNTDLRSWFKTLIAARKRLPALQAGSYQPLLAQDSPAGYAFARVHNGETVIAAMNAGTAPVTLNVPVERLDLQEGQELFDLFSHRPYLVRNQAVQITLEAFRGIWIA